jgi:hypothetical protein
VLPLSAVSGIESAQVSRTSLGHYWQMKVEVRGFPHLAKNERDVGPTLAFVAGTVPKKSQALLMNNRTLDRPRALDGLRPSFSAPRSLVEHGASVECAVARTVHCSLNLPQASRLLGMTILLGVQISRPKQNCHLDRSEAQWRDLRFPL